MLSFHGEGRTKGMQFPYYSKEEAFFSSSRLFGSYYKSLFPNEAQVNSIVPFSALIATPFCKCWNQHLGKKLCNCHILIYSAQNKAHCTLKFTKVFHPFTQFTFQRKSIKNQFITIEQLFCISHEQLKTALNISSFILLESEDQSKGAPSFFFASFAWVTSRKSFQCIVVYFLIYAKDVLNL